jgi:hypothetical protein
MCSHSTALTCVKQMLAVVLLERRAEYAIPAFCYVIFLLNEHVTAVLSGDDDEDGLVERLRIMINVHLATPVCAVVLSQIYSMGGVFLSDGVFRLLYSGIFMRMVYGSTDCLRPRLHASNIDVNDLIL